jgi:hypothetical protein
LNTKYPSWADAQGCDVNLNTKYPNLASARGCDVNLNTKYSNLASAQGCNVNLNTKYSNLASARGCDQLNGLKQYKNSCWFDACLVALFIPNDNFAYFKHIFERIEYGNIKIRSELESVIMSMRTGAHLQPNHSLYLSDLMHQANIISENTLKENSADNFLLDLLKFGRYNPNMCTDGNSHILTYSHINTKTYLNDIFDKIFYANPKYLIIKSIKNAKFIPSIELDTVDIRGNKTKLYLNSILTLKGNHYVTYIKCVDNNWYVYDGERAKDGFPLSKMSYFNVRLPNDKFVSELHAVSTSKKTFVYDYTNTIDSVNAYFIYTRKIIQS